MIQENTIWAISPLVDKLAKSGISLQPLGETPLTVLMQACEMPTAKNEVIDVCVNTGQSATTPAWRMGQLLQEGSTFRGMDGLVAHDVAMDELRPVIARVVGKNLDVARNQVNPLIKQVLADVQVAIANAQQAAVQKLAIQPDFFAPLWDTSFVEGMVSRYTETPVQPMRLTVSIPFPVDVMEALRSGAARFDDEIKAFIDELPAGYVQEVWDMAFGNGVEAQDSAQLFSPYGERDRVLLIHLFARRMLQQPPEGVNMDLSAFRLYVASMVEQSGRGVARILEKRQVDLQRKNLVIAYPTGSYEGLSTGDSIVVNGPVYNQWLEAGGKPEALFGSFLTDKLRGYDALLEQTPALVQVWNRSERLLSIKVRSDELTYATYAIRDTLTRVINDLPEDGLVVGRGVMHERLRDGLGMINGKKLEDLYGLIQTLVCRVIYPHTDALQILCTIDAIAKDNPDMDIREVALLATIDVVADWISKLYKVDVNL